MKFCTLLIALVWLNLTSIAHGADSNMPGLMPTSSLELVPVASKGRIAPSDAYARLWLFDLYHNLKIKAAHRAAFHPSAGSALELLWKMHFLGHTPWDDAPLFWLPSAQLKILLGLQPKEDNFSFNQLYTSLYSDKNINAAVYSQLTTYHFLVNYTDPHNRLRSEKYEVIPLSSGLWAQFQGDDVAIAATPHAKPWQSLSAGMVIAQNVRKNALEIVRAWKKTTEELSQLLSALNAYRQMSSETPFSEAYERELSRLESEGLRPKDIAYQLEMQFPLTLRLKQAGTSLPALPSRHQKGEWLSLKSLKVKIYNPATQKLELPGNFTLYSDAQFTTLRKAYLEIEKAVTQSRQGRASTSTPLPGDKMSAAKEPEVGSEAISEDSVQSLAKALQDSYASLIGKSYAQAIDKQLTYPSVLRLKAEQFYLKYPLIPLSMALYACAALLLALSLSLNPLSSKKTSSLGAWGVGLMAVAFFLHTGILGLRCLILQRPPVSNMFETVIYVPWVAVLISFALYFTTKRSWILLASSFMALAMLILLQITHLSSHLENVQAVLNSQYWLVVHVLMIVGSYGAFVLSGVLAHIYLGASVFNARETESMRTIGKLTLQTIYIGTALLIPGTILGGVWAAESWGRFWDWDPKESWAFISSCIYLICIHTFTFHHIRYFGLAVGSIIGLQAITFTWYGVNYILGTGLHSYGFGSGGERYYYLFLAAEMLCLVFAGIWRKWQQRSAA